MRWLVRLFELLVVAAAGWMFYEVGGAFSKRWDFPADLEWMEGATLISAWRVQQGLPIYGTPEMDYIPFIYPPLYAWVVGLLGHIWPVGYSLARLVSIFFSLLATLAVGAAARREGASWAFALGCMALFLGGTYDDARTFYDLVRVDAISVAFLGWALVLGRGATRGQTIASGILLAIAFMAKHNMAMFGFPIAISLWRQYGVRRAIEFAIASAGPALAFTIGVQIGSGGEFLTWLLEVPSSHGMVLDRLISINWPSGAQGEVWSAAPIFVTLGVFLPFWMWRLPGPFYWSGVSLIGLIVVSLMRGHTGGFNNVLIPMFWVVSVWPALVVAGWQARWPNATWLRAAAALLLAAQLTQSRDVVRCQSWNLLKIGCTSGLSKWIPTEKDRKDAAEFIDELKTLPEPILLPHGPWYLVMAGKTPSFSLITLWDIDHKGGPYRGGVKEVEKQIEAGYWASAVLPNDKLGYGIKEHYQRTASLKNPPPRTRLGWQVALKEVWKPKAPAGE